MKSPLVSEKDKPFQSFSPSDKENLNYSENDRLKKLNHKSKIGWLKWCDPDHGYASEDFMQIKVYDFED